MYESFFGLKRAPFLITPDPRSLYMSERHREALAHLLFGLRGPGGIVLLSGDIGAGKTTVVRLFLEQLPDSCRAAYIFNPKLSVVELLQSVCDEFGVVVQAAVPGAPTVKDHLDPLNRFLLICHGRGQQCVLVIDEAQNLGADVLEQLRLLTNLETAERKLLQIVLVGQPELRDLVARPELEQLSQRVVARCHLGPLTENETSRYLAHRLAVAGRKGALPFDAQALRRIFVHSRGVPRRINLVADRALLGAYASSQAVVGAAVVDRAAQEVLGTDGARRSTWWRPQTWQPWGLLAAGLLLGAVLAGVLAWAWWGRPAAPAVDGAAGSATLPAPLASAPAPAAGPGAAPADAGAAAARSGPALAVAGAAAPVPATAAPVPGTAAQGPAPLPSALPVPLVPPVPVPGMPAATPTGTPVVFDTARDWRALFDERDPAWRELALHWASPLGAGEPCAQLMRLGLGCYRASNGTLVQLRRLDRPAVLRLVDPQGRSGRVLLLALNNRQARVAVGTRQWRLPVAQLEQLWSGEFGTLWRMPPGYDKPVSPRAATPSGQALAEALAALPLPALAWPPAASAGGAGTAAPPPPPPPEPDAQDRLVAFQRAQGLLADGVAGPTTFMALNRARGLPEPRLVQE